MYVYQMPLHKGMKLKLDYLYWPLDLSVRVVGRYELFHPLTKWRNKQIAFIKYLLK